MADPTICSRCHRIKRGPGRADPLALCTICTKSAEQRPKDWHPASCPRCGRYKRGKARQNAFALCSVCANDYMTPRNAPIREDADAEREDVLAPAAGEEVEAPAELSEAALEQRELDYDPEGDMLQFSLERNRRDFYADLYEFYAENGLPSIADLRAARGVLEERFKTAIQKEDGARIRRLTRAMDRINRTLAHRDPAPAERGIITLTQEEGASP